MIQPKLPGEPFCVLVENDEQLQQVVDSGQCTADWLRPVSDYDFCYPTLIAIPIGSFGKPFWRQGLELSFAEWCEASQ